MRFHSWFCSLWRWPLQGQRVRAHSRSRSAEAVTREPDKKDVNLHGPTSPRRSGDLYARVPDQPRQPRRQAVRKGAPKTVANFVGLATGKQEWVDPRTGKKSNAKLYDGTAFHRVIPQFMIQGGDPLGTGTGGPGYKFRDEFPERAQVRPAGLLAMANAGPEHQRVAGSSSPKCPPRTSTPPHDLRRGGVKGQELVPADRPGRQRARTRLEKVEIRPRVRLAGLCAGPVEGYGSFVAADDLRLLQTRLPRLPPRANLRDQLLPLHHLAEIVVARC